MNRRLTKTYISVYTKDRKWLWRIWSSGCKKVWSIYFREKKRTAHDTGWPCRKNRSDNRVGFTYYANQKDVEIGKESVYGYDIQVDSEYMITIKEKSVAIGEDLWSKNTEVRKIKIQ